MSRVTNTGKLYYKGRSLASKCIRVSHHKEFTKACIEKNIIPKGIGLKFYPSVCADTSFEFTLFAAEKVHRTSEELLYYLDNHYIYAKQHTENKFMDFNPIWAGGGGQNAPLRVFAKYLKNGLVDLHETL